MFGSRKNTRLAQPALTSSLAIAAALAFAPQARAQSFDATSTLLAGSATVTTGTNTTTITVNTPTAVLQWTPNDTGTTGTINFQPANTTATFQGTPTSGNFAVLNNIVPTTTSRAIAFNGNVVSRLQDAAGNVSPGGTVFFYSPGGILVGSGATIDVGNLGLTTSPVAYDSQGEFRTFDAVTGAPKVTFGQAQAGSFVNVQPGAAIFAGYQNGNPFADGSYVALVAPSVRVGGAVHVDGSAALVAADASTITFSPDGLFDISVDVPTSALATNGAPLAVDPGGVITGPAASSSGTHAAYLVTAPRNTMLTLMVSGGASLGFDVAGAADVVGNRVVLSGGFNVTRGVADETTVVGGTGGTIDIVMNGASATSQVNISASGQGTVQSNATTLPANLDSGLSIHSLGTAFLAAGFNGVLTIAGNLDLKAIDRGTLVGTTGNVQGGGAFIFVNGPGQVNLNGATNTISANASAVAGTGGSATGGNARITTSMGGSVSILGDLTISADGTGASPISGAGAAGNGTGGQANIDVSRGNTFVSVGGSTSISARGIGGDCTDPACTTGGGAGQGGTAYIAARALDTVPSSTGVITLNGFTTVDASGSGGSGAVIGGGSGRGGAASVSVDNGNQIVSGGGIAVYANGDGGSANGPGIKGGSGTGGNAFIQAQTGGVIAFSPSFASVSANASGSGGSGFVSRQVSGEADGGDGIGGTAQVTVTGGTITGAFDISADAGGQGGSAFGATATATGGNGRGGTAFVSARKDALGNVGTISANYVDIFASGFGGSGFGAGIATGGNALATVTDGSLLQLANDLRVEARAFAGFGLSDPATFLATGGAVTVSAAKGAQLLIGGDARLSANGEGGGEGALLPNATVQAGNGKGGSINIFATDTNSIIDIGTSLYATADGFGFSGFCSTGCTNDTGNGQGGAFSLSVSSGASTPGGGSLISVGSSGSGTTFVSASGRGSFSTVSNGGTGTGGSINVSASETTGSSSPNAITFLTSADFVADGVGGDQAGTATVAQPLAGGLGTGGSVFVAANTGGSLTTSSNLNLSAAGRGGDGNNDTGGGGASGGAGVGGSATLSSSGGTAAFGGLVSVAANATGGTAFSPDASGFGGNAAGGTATVSARNGTTAVSGTLAFAAPLVVRSDATGGDGLNGGNGTGGLALVVAANGTITGGSVAIESSGSGGNGMASIDPATDGIVVGNGGIGTGGAPVTDTAGNVITDGGSQLVARTGQPVTGYAAGTIAFDSVELDSNGVGGAGGDAFSFDQPVNGGKGGDGFGGQTLALASAGNGTLSVNNLVQAFAVGSGGRGGNGSDSPAGDGGNGGAGGMGVGGNAQVGTQSGAASPNNLGQAQFGGIITVVNANGGSGGDGGNPTSSTGTFVQGLGGDGGAAFDGGTTLLVRGSPVTITGTPSSSGTGSVSLNANAFGGNGGNGRQQGVGGDATVGSTPTSNGGVAVLVTNRFQFPTQAGSLVANDISGGASAFGGAGSTAGNTIVGDQPLLFSAVNSNVTATDIGLFASGTAPTTSVIESPIALVNSTVDISNTLNFSSAGPISVSLDNSALNVQNAFLGGSDFVLPAVKPTNIGTFTITNGSNAGFHINSGANFFAYSNFVFPFDVSFNLTNGSIRLDDISGGNAFFADASGSIQLGNLAVSDLGLSAATTITIGNVNAVGNAQVFGDVSLDAGGTITTGNIATPTGLVSISSGAAVQTGGITASNDLVEIFATGDVSASGPISAGTNVVVNSGGSIFVQNVTGGTAQATQSSGNYDVQLVAANQIGVGNVTTPSLALISAGFTIGTGSISARDALILGNGATTVNGPVNVTGRVLFANSSMTSLGGSPGSGYNANAVFGAAPVPLGGPIVVNGPINAGAFVTAVTQNGFTGGSITVSSGSLSIDANGPISLGTLDAFTDVTVRTGNGTLAAGNISSRNGAVSLFNANAGDIAVGGIDASTFVQIGSAGNLNTGDISVGNGPLLVSLVGNASLGTLTAGGFVNINAGGFLGTRGITSPSSVVLVAGQNGAAPLTVSGSIVASDIFLASQGTIQAGSLTATAAASSSSTGSYQVFALADGGVTVGTVQADDLVIMASPQSITSGNIFSGRGVGLFATGNIDSGSISTPGNVVLADNAMYAIGDLDTGYDLDSVFNAARINGTGDYLVGSVRAAGLKAGTFGRVSFDNVAANGLIDIFGGTSLSALLVDTAGFVNLASGGDITTDNIGLLQATSGVSVTGNGFVTTGSVATTGSVLLSGNTGLSSVDVSAGSDVTLSGGTGPLTAGIVSGASLVANGGAVSIGTIGSDTFVSVSGNSVLLGSVDAGTYVDISGGSIGISGLIDASDTVDLNATGDISVFGPILSGGDITAIAGGAIDVNDVSAGFNRGNVAGATRNVGLAAGTSLTAGNLTATDDIGLLAQTTLTAGNLSGREILLLAHGDIVAGAISSRGRVLAADASLAALGGTIGVNFDPNPVFAGATVMTLPNVRTAGSITVNGPIDTVVFTAAAGTGLGTAGITATADILLNSGGTLTTGALTAGGSLDLRSLGNMQTGDVDVAVTLPTIFQNETRSAAFVSQGNITTGNVRAADLIAFFGQQTLTTGSLTAIDLLGLAHGDIAVGPVNVTSRALFADNSMGALGASPTAPFGFDRNLVFAAPPVRTAGSITFNGPVLASSLRAAAGTDILAGNVTGRFVAILNAANRITAGNVDAGLIAAAVTQTGDITIGNVTAGTTLNPAAPADGHFAVIIAGGSLNAGNITASEDISLVAQTGTMSLGTITAPKVSVLGKGDIAIQAISSTGQVRIDDASLSSQILAANGIINLQPVFDADPVRTAGAIAIANPLQVNVFRAAAGTAFTAPSIRATSEIQINAGTAAVNTIDGGANVLVIADSLVSVGNVTSGTVLLSTDPNDEQNIGLISSGAVQAGNLTALDVIGLAGNTITAGNLSATDMLVLGHGDIAVGAVTARSRVLVADQSMLSIGGTIGLSNSNFDPNLVFAATPVRTAGAVRLNGPVLTSSLQVSAGTDIVAGDIAARVIGRLDSGNTITAGNLDAGAIAIAITQTGAITLGNVTAGTKLTLPTTTLSHFVGIGAGGTLTTGDLTALDLVSVVSRNSTTSLGTLTAPQISVLGKGDIAIQAINSTGQVRIDDASLSSLITASGGIVNLQGVFDADPVRTGGAIDIATPVHAFDFTAAAGTTFTAPAITAKGIVQINAADASVSSIDAGADVLVLADNTITVGNVTSGTVLASPNPSDTQNIGLIAGGALQAGNLSALDVIGLSGATIAAGNLSSNEMLILGHGDIGVGRIAAIGRVLIADQSMLPIGGTIGTNNSDYDPNLVFSATPVRTAGTVTIDGRLSTVGNAVDGSDLTIASGGDVTVIGNMFGTGQTRIDSGGGFSQTGGVIGLPLGSLTIVANGPVTTQQVTVGGQNGAPGAIAITTTGAVSTGQLGATNGVAITAGSSLTTGNVFTSGGNVALIGGAAVQAGNVTANSGSVSIAAGTTLTAAAIRAATTLSLSAPGAISVGVLGGNSLNAAGAITVNGGDITIAQGNQVFSSQSSVTLTSTGNVTTGVVSGQTGVTITATGNIDTGGHGSNTGPTTLTAGGSVRTGQINSAGIVVNAGTTFQSGNLDSSNGISITTGGGLATSFLSSAGSIVLTSGAGLSAGQIRTVSGDIQSSSVGNSNIFSFISAGKVDFSAQGSFTASRPITAVGQINGQSAGAMTLSDVTSSGGGISLASSGALTTGNLSSFADLTISGGPSVTTGTLATTGAAGTTTSSVSVTSGGTLSTGAINAATDVTITAPNAAIVPGTSGVGAITAGRNIVINAASFSSTQPLSSNGGLTITTAGPLALGSITARQSVQLTSGASISAGPIQAQFGVVANAGTTLTLGAITANGGVVLTSGGAMQLGGVTTISPIVLSSGGTLVSSGFLTSSNNLVIGVAQGNMSLAGVAAGTIELSSAASINTGLLRATGNAVVIAGQSLTVSQAQALQLALLAGNSITTGPLLAGITVDPTTGQITGATGRILIANASQGALGGKFGQGTYDFNAVFNATPVLAAGTVTVNGTVTAGEFRSYSQGNMSAQVVNAFNNIEVQSGGLVTVGQRWTSPDLTIISNDIDIQPSRAIQPTPTNPNPGNTTAGLNAGKAGDIVLLSTNANGQFVGDGLTVGSGYGLSGAEFALINSGSVVIGAQDVQANAIDQTIGNLAITGPQAGSTIDDPNGTVLFATGDVASQTPGTGGIKIVGAITAKGFLATNTLAFETGTIEMDVTKGSIAVTDSAGALAGNITIDADRIHFAEQSILDKLRADPFYVGHVQDLNTPPATPPSGPVISAATLEFVPKQTLYIQNTGTQQVQAGFLAPSNGLTIEPSPPAQNQTVSVTINGQFSNGGTTPNTTGSDAFTQFVTQDKLSNISSDSQFNTCSLAGSSCAGPLADMPPQPDISNTIQVLQTNTLPEPPIAEDPQSEEQKDTSTKEEQAEEKAATAAKSPIAPPAPLVDTRPLNPPVTVDEPVAGSGNPALIDTIRPIQGGSQ